MNTKPAYTPGPWKIDPTNAHRITQDGNPFFTISAVSGFDSGQRDANARLIAAAPELLAACKALENVFAATERANAGWRDFAVCNLQDALKQARAAIAKAEGQP